MQQDAATAESKIAILTLAIEQRVVIGARYNAEGVELWPHQLIERNGATYVRAVNPAKSRLRDEPATLGLFHLGGLSDLALKPAQFEPLPSEATTPARTGDEVVATI